MNYLKYLLKSKWIFTPPKKNKYILVDGSYNPFSKLLNKKDITILYRRGEEINLFILFNCIINLKFSTLEYCKEFIKHVSPKLIITGFDYHTIFYKLSKATGIKTLMIQKGNRTINEGIIANTKKFFPKNSRKEYFVDYIFVFNEKVKNFYKNKIGGKYFVIGSFENNFTKLNKKKIKNEIVFLSNYHPTNIDKRENEDVIVERLLELAADRKLKLNILPRLRNMPNFIDKEINFYNNLGDKKLNFILDKTKSSYEILLKYKYVFASYSTLAAEFLAKGGRAGFIMLKSNKNPIFDLRYGVFEGLNEKGLFWTSSRKFEESELKRVFKFVIETKNKAWKKKTKLHIEKVMNFDYKNKVIKTILNKHK